MATRDLISNVKNVLHYAKTLTATETPTGAAIIDTRGYDSVQVAVAIGAITNIANSPIPSWTFKLQESDGSDSPYTFTDVAEADMLLDYGSNDGSVSSGVFATVDAADEDDAIYTVGYRGTKRYLRVVATAADTPGATPVSVVFTLGDAHLTPVSD